MVVTTTQLKSYFETGDTPTQAQFENLIDTLGPNAGTYKRYTALLTQAGTAAPTATVLENTLGGAIVWTRTNIGQYRGTLSGAFTANKTIVAGSDTDFANPNTGVYTTIRSSAHTLEGLYKIGRTSDDIIDMTIYDNADTVNALDWAALVTAAGMTAGTPFLVDIKVYI